MDNPFAIRPEQIAEEIYDFNRRLTRGMHTLTEVGEIQAGVSPRDPVFEEDKLVLYHYRPRKRRLNPIPVLIVYALVNRPYMADLEEGRSLVQGMLEAGLDVYLIDWGYPDETDSHLSLDDYIEGYLDRCVDVVRERHDLERINLLGICQGGTFALCYTALHQDKVKNLITTVTPVDFHTRRDMLSHLVRHVDIDQCVDAMGNIPGEMMNWVFLMLKPFRLLGRKYVDLVDILDDPDKVRNFVRMEKWIFDSPAQAGQAFREFVTGFYQDNKLVKGQIRIGGKAVDLERITIPVLNIYARDDHLVPQDASRALAGCVSSKDYSELEFPGGHIGLYVSARSQQLLPPAIAEWLGQRRG